MKKILRYFGYVPMIDVLKAAQEYNDKQGKIVVETLDEACEENYKGIGAMDFAVKFYDDKIF